jgi:hypothetical protein
MRTTREIDDDVLQAARSIAAAKRKSIGKALSYRARRGPTARSQSATRSVFPVFDVAPDATPITLEVVKNALDEQ